MITMTAIVKVNPEKQKEFLQTIHSLQNNGRRIENIRGVALYRDEEDPTSFSVINEWESNDDFENYLKGESFMVFLGAVEVLCEKSEIKYNTHKGIQSLNREMKPWNQPTKRRKN